MGIDKAELKGRYVGQDFTIKDGWRMYHGFDVPGFPYHPHRGFETVTINKEGFIDHSDSLGASGRFGAGDVQWMTAGSGVQHSEMFPLLHEDKANPLELFQVWLNLPKASKMVEPHFKMLWAEKIPHLVETDDRGRRTEIDLIAGRYKGNEAVTSTPNSWAASPESGVVISTIKVTAGAQWEIPASETPGVNRTLYFYRGGEIQIGERRIPHTHSIHLDSKQEAIVQNGEEDAFLLFLQGKPIGESVVQHGPFVMNTQEEIEQTFEDYRKTQFGGWPWPKREQVHARGKGRFALHSDGREEVPG